MEPVVRNSSESVTPLCTFEPLRGEIERLLEGELQRGVVNEHIEQYLNGHGARPELVTAARELRDVLEQAGYLASVRYCKSATHGHPIPIVTAQASDGEYVLPNINAVWNPTLLEERGGGSNPRQKQVLAPDSTDEIGRPERFTLRIERFSSSEPVCLALLPTSVADAPAEAYPIFSPEAFSAARRHAATVVRKGDITTFSYIRDEVLVPQIRNEIRRTSALFGEREMPELVDCGSAEDGTTFKIKTFVPLRDATTALTVRIAVKMDAGRFFCC